MTPSAFDIILRRTQAEAIDPPELLFSSRSYDLPQLDLLSFGATFAEFFTPVRLISDDLSSGSSSNCSSHSCEDGDTRRGQRTSSADSRRTSETTTPTPSSRDVPKQIKPFLIPKYLRVGCLGAQWTREMLFNGDRGEIGLAWSIF